MFPLTLEMCPLILKFETNPSSLLLLQPRQIALGGYSDGEQGSCLAQLSSAHWRLSFSMESWRLGSLMTPGFQHYESIGVSPTL